MVIDENVVEVQETQAKQANDPLADELAAIEAQIAAEEAKPAEQPATETAQAAEVAKEQPTEEQLKLLPDEHGNQVAAIIAMRKKLQEANANNLLLQGQNQALLAITKNQNQGVPQEQAEPATQVDPVQAIRQEQIALAMQCEEGDISISEMEQKRQELEDRLWLIREANMRATAQPAPQTDLYLEQATAKLETDFPVLQTLTAAELSPIAEIARRQAEREGVALQGAAGTLELRARIARLAQGMYGTTTPSVTTQQAGLSDAALARESKLATASKFPPDITQMGSAARDTTKTDAEILASMDGKTEEEQWAILNALPSSTKIALRR